ncbi:MAG TPA: hypothetical protein DEP84_32555 [Chloroflexi bacterium]|nr:hypothetical protein [Chloroflexota bacterium]
MSNSEDLPTFSSLVAAREHYFGSKYDDMYTFVSASLPDLKVFAYRGVPELHYVLFVTEGLSGSGHPAWRHSCPELFGIMKSDSTEWARSVGALVNPLRGDFAFERAKVLYGNAPLSYDTDMSGILISYPLSIEPDEQTIVANGLRITFSQLYPVYKGEGDLLRDIGLSAFMAMIEQSCFNPTRSSLCS